MDPVNPREGHTPEAVISGGTNGQPGGRTGKADVVVEARGVSKVFVDKGSTTVALQDVDLAVERGTFVSVVGPSGCGKSTMLRILGGLESATTGEVIGAGVRSAFVFQDHSLFPWLRVLDNVAFGLRMSKVGREERTKAAMAWIGRVGLSGFERAFPDQLSGGMRQRISLARAFVTEPDLLLMDEPMAALDPQTRLLMQEDLVRLWEETKKTVVLVTHSLEEAILLGDYVVVMTARPGRIKALFEVGLDRPRNAETTTTPGFSRLRAMLWEALREEVERSLRLLPGVDE